MAQHDETSPWQLSFKLDQINVKQRGRHQSPLAAPEGCVNGHNAALQILVLDLLQPCLSNQGGKGLLVRKPTDAFHQVLVAGFIVGNGSTGRATSMLLAAQ